MLQDPELSFDRRREIVRAVTDKFVVEDASRLVPYYNLLNPFLIDNSNVLTLESSVKRPSIILPQNVIVKRSYHMKF